MTIHAYAALAPKQTLQLYEYTPKPLGPSEVEVKITHCGVCHSDIHLIDDDWKVSQYPLIPGHEIVGFIEAVGSQATHLKPKQRVGIGWQCGSCGVCEECAVGDENLCLKQQATCVGHFGGFAERVRAEASFVIPLPENLPSEQTAPLFCGGATVYAPLRCYVAPHMRVGIIGIGGLGHLAIKFARAMGCEITAFTSNLSKTAEIQALGAHHVLVSNDKIALNKIKNTLDFILCTTMFPLDWSVYMDCLRPKGMLCFVGAVSDALTLPLSAFRGRKAITFSNIASPHLIREMLAFAAQHQITAQTECFPLNEVNTALQKVREGKVRYRAVLDIQKL